MRGLGEDLMQEGHVVYYESWKLNDKHNYWTHDLELVEIIHVLKMWRHYLLGRMFLLMNGHSELRYLFDQLNLNSTKTRWLAMITQFNFEIRYMKCKENKVADALSRWIQVKHRTTTSSYETDLQDHIL